MFGYYGDTADIRMFLEKPKPTGVSPKPEVLNLRHLRFIKAEEAGQHSKYDVEFLKMITGGSSVTARFGHANTFYTFLPYVRVWIASNWAPGAEYIDQALWNRLLAVPFTNVIPKEKQDGRLVEKLTMKPEHNKAILAWMVRGCLDWQKYGLEIPEIVAEQTRLLREQNDDLMEFKEENLEITGDDDDYVLCKKVYDVYTLWCTLQGIPVRFRKRNRSLYEQLVTIPGIRKSNRTEFHDGTRGQFFYGLNLKPTALALLVEEISE